MKMILARLIFLEADDFYSGLLLQAGPNSQETQYQFPCTLENGTLTIGWRQGKNRGCQEGIYISPTKNNTKNHAQKFVCSNIQKIKRTQLLLNQLMKKQL